MNEKIDSRINGIKKKYPNVTDDMITECIMEALSYLDDRLDKQNYLKIGDIIIGPEMKNKIGRLVSMYSDLLHRCKVCSDDTIVCEFVKWLIDNINNLEAVKYKKIIQTSDSTSLDVDFSYNAKHYILKIKTTEKKGQTIEVSEDSCIFDDLNKSPEVSNTLKYREKNGRRSIRNESEKFENLTNMFPLSESEQEFARSLIKMNPVLEATLNNNLEYYHETSYGFSERLEKKSQDSPVKFIFIRKIDNTNLIDLTITPKSASIIIYLDNNGMVPLTSEIYNKLHVDNAIAGEIRSILQAAASFGTDVISDIPTELQPQQEQGLTTIQDSNYTGETPDGEDGR